MGMGNSLVELNKKEVLSVPPDQWMSDDIPDSELTSKIAKCTIIDQARYAFFTGNYEELARLLGGKTMEELDMESLILLAWSHDSLGLNKPDLAKKYLEEILIRKPSYDIVRLALEALKKLP